MPGTPKHRKHCELADLGCRCIALEFDGEYGVDARQQGEGRFSLQTPHRLGHERIGGLEDGASFALEGNVGDGTSGEFEVEPELVATQRVDSLGRPGRTIDRAGVSRMACMIDDRFLVFAV